MSESPSTPPHAAASARTIILTTHQAHLAEPLAETTLTMRAGTIVSRAAAAVHISPPGASPAQWVGQ
jgi:energy-coupling factor transporter ATP-binding protein EcfA2